jgi:chromosome segregation ATPase
LASLEKLVLKLRQKKQETSKLRSKAEKQLKDLRSIERRSSSGLVSLDKKIELEQEDSSDVSDLLIQKTSQLESIQRLVTAAEEYLNREKEELLEAEQQLEFAENHEEKKNAEFRVKSIKTHIEDLEFEIKSRQKTAKKITGQVEINAEIKSKITSKIKKQSQSKPSLRDSMISSHKDAKKFENKLEKSLRAETTAKKSLGKAVEKLKVLQEKMRKAAAKKKAIKRKTAKRPARKTAPKRKTAKRPARTASRNSKPKK